MFRDYFNYFLPADIEPLYRQFIIRRRTKVVRNTLIVGFFLNLTLFFTNAVFIQPDGYLGSSLFFIRLSISLLIVMTLIRIRKTVPYDVLNRIVLIFFAILAVLSFIVFMVRDRSVPPQFLVEMLIMFAIFFLFPIELKYQLIIGVFFGIDIIAVKWIFYPEAATGSLITFMVLASIIVGLIAAHYYHVSSRRLFQQKHHKDELLAELKQQEAELKSIRQLIPICSNCSSIRDDNGFWNQLEDYMREHEDMVFTMNICPDCEAKK